MTLIPLYFFALIQVYFSWKSLASGIRFLKFCRESTSVSPGGSQPFASVIVPCRGLDKDLKKNLRAIADQEYDGYEIIFVVDSESDPSLPVIEAVRSEAEGRLTTVVVAGEASDSGQKVHNLIAATGRLDEKSTLVVFVDSDARPSRGWLANLVGAAMDSDGCATGYRWFFPVRGSLASNLRSVWNASIASALGPSDSGNFCWGGSTAITRDLFDRLEVREGWKGALSDDFALTEMLKRDGKGVRFVPQCLAATVEDCGFGEMLEFTTRQMKITRVYRPDLWTISFAGSLVFALAVASAVLLIASGDTVSAGVGAFVLLFILFTGSLKAWLRLKAVGIALPDYEEQIRRQRLSHLVLWTVTPLIYLWNDFAAIFSRRITWRGITYELVSSSKTRILGSRS